MFLRTLAAALLAGLTTLPTSALAQHDHGVKAARSGDHATPGRLDEPVIEITVTRDGFVPSTVSVRKGHRVRLVVTRTVERTCATEIVIKDQGIARKLPLDQPVSIEFTPSQSGRIRYACGMDMISGVLVVE